MTGQSQIAKVEILVNARLVCLLHLRGKLVCLPKIVSGACPYLVDFDVEGNHFSAREPHGLRAILEKRAKESVLSFQIARLKGPRPCL